MKVIVIFCLCQFLLIASFAQEKNLCISPEIRTLSVFDGGYKNPGEIDSPYLLYTTQRTRLNLKYLTEDFETFISIQDVRIWGDDDNYGSSGALGNAGSCRLHQAWGKYDISKDLMMKIGRQLLSYDDQRLLSARNWNDNQITYDALLLEYKIRKHRVNLGLSYNAEDKTSYFYPSKKFKYFDFLHYQYSGSFIKLSGIGLLTGNTLTDTSTQIYYRGTYGINTVFSKNTYESGVSAYYQQNLNKTGGSLSAYCVTIYFQKELLDALNFGIGMDYISGNSDNTNSDINRKFDLLYGRRHGYYGYMDYFSNTPEQGLQDYMIKLSYGFNKNTRIYIDWHYFMLSEEKYDLSTSDLLMKKQLGQEIDIKFKTKLKEQLNIEAGYSVYNPTNLFTQVKLNTTDNIGIQQFFYLMLSFKPEVWLK